MTKIRRSNRSLRAVVGIVLAMTLCPTMAAASGVEMAVRIDASELPRKLLHAEITIDLPADTVAVLYPRWVPGLHGPRGPIEYMYGFSVRDAAGRAVSWERDWRDPYRFYIDGTGAQNPCTIQLSYICNHGLTVYGFPGCGSVDWHAITVYPEGIPVDKIAVAAEIVVPEAWQLFTALAIGDRNGDTVTFAPVSLRKLIDNPVICGVYATRVPLVTTNNALYTLNAVASTVEFLPGDSARTDLIVRLINETEELFSRTHFDTYRFLSLFDDGIHSMGVEHRNSSLNFFRPGDLTAEALAANPFPDLIPHEFVHSWCGKYRCPAGMMVDDYMVPQNMDLLWVYEGLTQYLGLVLSARSGFMTRERFKETIASYMATAMIQQGRRWRSLRDNQISAYLIWEGRSQWQYLKRGVDFYTEGALIWLDIDARIRETTTGRKTLDDFCRDFFGTGDTDAFSIPFTYDDVISGLNAVAAGPWDSLLTVRLNSTETAYDPDWISRCGYRLTATPDKPDYVARSEKGLWEQNYSASIGLIIGHNGVINEVVPGSPADRAGCYPGLKIAGVGDDDFSSESMEQSVRNSRESGAVLLTVGDGEDALSIRIDYGGGLRYLVLERLEGTTDWLDSITNPLIGD